MNTLDGLRASAGMVTVTAGISKAATTPILSLPGVHLEKATAASRSTALWTGVLNPSRSIAVLSIAQRVLEMPPSSAS